MYLECHSERRVHLHAHLPDLPGSLRAVPESAEECRRAKNLNLPLVVSEMGFFVAEKRLLKMTRKLRVYIPRNFKPAFS